MPTFTFDITGNFVANAPGTMTIEADTYEEAAKKAVKEWRDTTLDFDLEQIDLDLTDLDIGGVRKDGGPHVDLAWASEDRKLCEWDLAALREADQAEVSA